MKMKNDISILLDDYLSLYEHQSTFNPNMPLRGLLYFADLYRQLFGSRHLYSTKLLHERISLEELYKRTMIKHGLYLRSRSA